MTDATQLPVYIQARYRENGVFAEMESDFKSATSRMTDGAKREFGELDRFIKQAVASGGKGARLDLGIDELRAAEAAHERNAAAARVTAQAWRQASAAGDEYSAKALQAAASADRMAHEEAAAAQALREKANVLDLAQRELDEMTRAQDAATAGSRRFGAANDNVTREARAMRAGLGMANQQLVDVGVQLTNGTRASVALSQQLPQLGWALSGLANSSNKTTARIGHFAGVLSGPLGLAVGLAAGSLIDLAFRTDEAADAADRATAAHDSFADAQSLLGQVIDLTTGRLENQNVVLRESIRLTAQRQILEGQKAERAALRDLGRGERYTALERVRVGVDPGAGMDPLAQLRAARDAEAAARGAQPLADAIDAFRSGKTGFEGTIRDLERLGEAGRLAGQDLLDLKEKIISVGVARNEQEAAQLVIDALEGRGLDARLRRPGAKPSKPKVDRSAEKAAREADRLTAASEAAAEAVQRVSEAYDDQPRYVDKVAQSLRKLEQVRADLYSRKNVGPDGKSLVPGAAQIEADLSRVEAQVRAAISRQIDLYAEGTDKQLDLLRLEAQGLQEQADIKREIAALDEQFGLSGRAERLEQERATLAAILDDETLTADKRAESEAALARTNNELGETLDYQKRIADEAERRVQEEKALEREAMRVQALLQAQLDVLDTARGAVRDIASGRSTDILGNLRRSIQDLQGARLFDDMFGNVFDELEDELSKNSPLAKANAALAGQVDETSKATHKLGVAVDELRQYVERATRQNSAHAAGAAVAAPGMNNSLVPLAANDNVLTVIGKRDEPTEIGRRSIGDISDRIAEGIVGPLLAGFDDLLGTKFAVQLSGVLSSVMSGYIRGGEVGGILGGLSGLNDKFGTDLFGDKIGKAISDKLANALEGAQAGTMVSGIGNALGIKMSTTGSQLGGALGSLIPIPGGEIIGAIAGGFLGNLFKGKEYGTAVVSSGGITPGSGKGKGRVEGATTLAGAVDEGIARIVEQLGAQMGSYRVSIGTFDNSFRVSRSGYSGSLNGNNLGRSDLAAFNNETDAIMYAIRDAISDGAAQGLKAAEARLLNQGGDLEAAVRDVLDFRSVFERLREYKDPIGAAVDRIDDEFERLRDLFQKAGASAAEYADLEELYGIERAKAIEDANERVVGSLRALMNDLTIGDAGLSLRPRRANALEDYNSLAARVQAGDTSAYDEFTQIARQLLDIERELYGSTDAYFARLNEVTDLTRTRIDAETNVSPFDPALNISSAITGQNEFLSYLPAINDNLIRVGQLLQSGAESGALRAIPAIQKSLNF